MFNSAGSKKTGNITLILIFFDFITFFASFKTLFIYLFTSIKKFLAFFLYAKKLFVDYLEIF